MRVRVCVYVRVYMTAALRKQKDGKASGWRRKAYPPSAAKNGKSGATVLNPDDTEAVRKNVGREAKSPPSRPATSVPPSHLFMDDDKSEIAERSDCRAKGDTEARERGVIDRPLPPRSYRQRLSVHLLYTSYNVIVIRDLLLPCLTIATRDKVQRLFGERYK